MNLTEELDRSFGSGPEHRPIEDRLAAGHRVVRRRRVATTAAAALAVVAIGTAGFAVSGGNDPSSDKGVATQPSADPSEPVVLQGGMKVGLDCNDELHTAKGVEVVKTVDNPMGYAPPEHSIGVAYTVDGVMNWALLTCGATVPPGGSGYMYDVQLAQPSVSFEDWLADEVAWAKEDQQGPDMVSFGDGETLLPSDGTEILQQTGHLEMMPPNFAASDDRTAAAEINYHGERWYVLARQVPDSPPEYIPFSPEMSRPTFEGFLSFAADKYAEGVGLR